MLLHEDEFRRAQWAYENGWGKSYRIPDIHNLTLLHNHKPRYSQLTELLTPMALTIPNTSAGGRILYTTPTRHTLNRSYNLNFSPSSSQTRTLHVTAASKKTSSRTGRFDSRNRRSSTTTTTEEPERAAEIERQSAEIENFVDDGYVVPDLPGLKPDFWEGEQWEPLGFFIEYMWAFGVVFSVISPSPSP